MQDEKQKYIDEMKGQLERLQGRLNDIEAQAAKAGESMKEQYAEHVSALEAKMNEARGQLDELQSAGEDQWSSAKEKVQKAWDDVNNAFTDATASLSK